MKPTLMLAITAILYGQSTPPQALPHGEPDYTEEARKAEVNATAQVKFLVGTDGAPKNIAITRGPGFGLDEKAIASVSQWRFKPATKDGTPVERQAVAEVTFRTANARHTGQFARLMFALHDGARRPELTDGKIPDNPQAVGAYKLRIALTVAANGKVTAASVIESTNPPWGATAARQVSGWRFRSGGREVLGELELTRAAP